MSKTIYPLPGGGLRGDPPVQVAFSNGVKVSGGEMLFISGQLGRDENNQIVGKGDIGAQTRQILKNIQALLESAGGTMKDIVKVTVFITDMSRFREIHEARMEFFHPDHLPASTMVEITRFTTEEALIEIEAIAVLGG
jgi:reactive intermediate/imine deaminase